MSLLFLVFTIIGFFWLLVSIIAAFQFVGMLLQLAVMNDFSPFWNPGNPFAWVCGFIAVGFVFWLIRVIMLFVYKPIRMLGEKTLLRWMETKSFKFVMTVSIIGGTVLTAVALLLSYFVAGFFLRWAETTGATDYFLTSNFWAYAITTVVIAGLLFPTRKRKMPVQV